MNAEISDLAEERRAALLMLHPIVQREYTISTRMLMSAYAIVRDRVWTRRTGVVFFGPPRIGKTKCAEEIREMLAEEFPHAFVSITCARSILRPNDGHMFRLILEGLKHVLAARPDPDRMLRNALTDIELELIKRNGSQYVHIIDEAHLLHDVDWQQLVIFQNALARKKIKMTTVSFAQPEIQHRRTALMAKKQTQIIARFLSEPLRFETCASMEDLSHLLESYDANSEFPERSGVTFTQFFVPNAYANGFRLATYAPDIWNTLELVAGNGLDRAMPMEHLCLLVEHLLLKLRREDCAGLHLSAENIEEAVEASNLATFCDVMDVTAA
jgi:hypothetical protein